MRSGAGGGTGPGADDDLSRLYSTTQPLPPLPEYLPQDNDDEAAGGAGAFPDAATTGVLRLQTKALKALLAVRRPAVFLRWEVKGLL